MTRDEKTNDDHFDHIHKDSTKRSDPCFGEIYTFRTQFQTGNDTKTKTDQNFC